jgi:hypothetical protein
VGSYQMRNVGEQRLENVRERLRGHAASYTLRSIHCLAPRLAGDSAG